MNPTSGFARSRRKRSDDRQGLEMARPVVEHPRRDAVLPFLWVRARISMAPSASATTISSAGAEHRDWRVWEFQILQELRPAATRWQSPLSYTSGDPVAVRRETTAPTSSAAFRLTTRVCADAGSAATRAMIRNSGRDIIGARGTARKTQPRTWPSDPQQWSPA